MNPNRHLKALKNLNSGPIEMFGETEGMLSSDAMVRQLERSYCSVVFRSLSEKSYSIFRRVLKILVLKKLKTTVWRLIFLWAMYKLVIIDFVTRI